MPFICIAADASLVHAARTSASRRSRAAACVAGIHPASFPPLARPFQWCKTAEDAACRPDPSLPSGPDHPSPHCTWRRFRLLILSVPPCTPSCARALPRVIAAAVRLIPLNAQAHKQYASALVSWFVFCRENSRWSARTRSTCRGHNSRTTTTIRAGTLMLDLERLTPLSGSSIAWVSAYWFIRCFARLLLWSDEICRLLVEFKSELNAQDVFNTLWFISVLGTYTGAVPRLTEIVCFPLIYNWQNVEEWRYVCWLGTRPHTYTYVTLTRTWCVFGNCQPSKFESEETLFSEFWVQDALDVVMSLPAAIW
jgi:hypothetical protein